MKMKPSLICLIVLFAALSGKGTVNTTITVVPNAAVALINDSIVFNCSTTSVEVEWVFGSYQYPRPIIYSYGAIKHPYEDLFQVQNYSNSFGNQFNMIILSVAKTDAGRYICQDPDRPEERKEVHLTVLEKEPVCESNLNVSELIGPNSCAVKPTIVQLSCGVRYIGSQVPDLQWIKADENIAINSSTCSASGNIYTCNLRMESELQMEGSSYVCQTTQSRTRKYNCTSGVFRILYALGEHKEITRSENDTVNCSVKSNSQSCTYSWKFDNGIINKTDSYDLVIKLKRPGRYICEAICPIKDINCTFAAMTVYVNTMAVLQNVLGDHTELNRAVNDEAICSLNSSMQACILSWLFDNGTTNWTEFQKGIIEFKRPGRFICQANCEIWNNNYTLTILTVYVTVNAGHQGVDETNIPIIIGIVFIAAVGAVFIGICVGLYLRNNKSKSDQISRTITPKTVEHRTKRVRGLSVLNDKLFVAFELSDVIEIFPIDISGSHSTAKVKDLWDPGSIAACTKNNCLYIMDQRKSNLVKKIFRVNPDGTVITIWETDSGERGRLSVNSEGNVVMTVYYKHMIKVYSPVGLLLIEHTIDLSQSSMTYVYHAINSRDETFILCHGMLSEESKLHRVCKIDRNGDVLKSFGRENGSYIDQLSSPVYLGERNDGSILVADHYNNRIIQLSAELEFKTVLFTKENGNVRLPRAMDIYEKTGYSRLFVGCNETHKNGGYVQVLRLDQSGAPTGQTKLHTQCHTPLLFPQAPSSQTCI